MNLGYESGQKSPIQSIIRPRSESQIGIRVYDWTADDIIMPQRTGSSIVEMGRNQDGRLGHFRATRLGGILSPFVSNPAGGAMRFGVIHHVSGTGIRILSGNNHDCDVSDMIVSEAKGVHANGCTVYQLGDDLRLARIVVFDSYRPSTNQAGESVTSRTYEDCVFVSAPKAEGGENVAMAIDGSSRNLTATNIIAIGAQPGFGGVNIAKEAQHITLKDVLGTKHSNGQIVNQPESENSDTWDVSDVNEAAGDYLEQNAEILEIDHVKIPMPDNTTLEVDLSGVGL